MSKIIHSFVAVILLIGFSACGVKGDPKPPLVPAAMGHGQPSFKRATKILTPTPVVDPEATPVPKPKNPPSEQE